MKRNTLSLACGLVLAGMATGAAAEYELSANVAMTTDYVWRGISQNDEDPAIQGGFDFEHESGFYLGTWGSNVNASDPVTVRGEEVTLDSGSMELDVYGGFATELENGIGIDLGAVAYLFPGYDEWDTEEYYIGGSYDLFGLMLYYNNDADSMYYDASLDFELQQDAWLGLHVGYSDPDDGESATDWKVAVGKSLLGVDWEVAYTDTDYDGSDGWADSRVFLTVSKSF